MGFTFVHARARQTPERLVRRNCGTETTRLEAHFSVPSPELAISPRDRDSRSSDHSAARRAITKANEVVTADFAV